MNHFRFRLDGIDVFRIEMTDNTSMATTDRFHFEDPQRHHYISSDTSSLSGEKMAELDSIIEDILSSRQQRIVVVVDVIPEENLEPATTVPNVYQLRDASETARSPPILRNKLVTQPVLFKRVDFQTTL